MVNQNSMEKNYNNLLTRAEVMRLLKVSGVTLSKYTTTKKLTYYYKVGRRLLFDREELLDEIKNQKSV